MMEQLTTGSSALKTTVTASSFVVFTLQELIELLGTDDVLAGLQRFTCARNADVEQFLRSQALLFEAAHKTRTYLLINAASLEDDPSQFELFGYFTLSIADLSLPETGLSKSKKKDLNGLFYPRGDKLFGFLIGQLGKDDRYADTALAEGSLVRFPLELLAQRVQPWIGGRFVLVECKEDLTRYYLDNGFIRFTEDSPADEVQLLYMLGDFESNSPVPDATTRAPLQASIR